MKVANVTIENALLLIEEAHPQCAEAKHSLARNGCTGCRTIVLLKEALNSNRKEA